MSAKCKGHAVQSFIWDAFMATKSIYSISVVLSYNHITNVKGHTCYTAIYLEATIIAPNYSPQEFVLMFVHLCVYVSVCFLGLVGVLQADLNLFFCLFSLKKKCNYNVGLRLFPSPKHEHLMNNIFFLYHVNFWVHVPAYLGNTGQQDALWEEGKTEDALCMLL